MQWPNDLQFFLAHVGISVSLFYTALYLQVELSSTTGSLDMTYVISLYPLSMATAVIVKNNGRKPVALSSAILSHLRSKKRGGTAIQGLRGCSYCSHPPVSSPFELLSPAEAMKTESSGWFSSETEPKPGVWSVQDVPITILKGKLSRVYAAPPKERLKAFYNTPPSRYEALDQVRLMCSLSVPPNGGRSLFACLPACPLLLLLLLLLYPKCFVFQGRELFFRIIRIGFEDIYVSSPGSSSEKFGREYFICTGPASVLVPAVVKPGEHWRGAQVIEHDNL